MKKWTRILSFLLAVLMLSCMLVACESSDDKDGMQQTTTGKTEDTTTTKKNDTKPTVKIKFVDSLTGETIDENTRVAGSRPITTKAIDNRHYGYSFIGYQYNDDPEIVNTLIKIYEDTVITVKYELKPLYEIKLYSKTNKLLDAQFEFKRALTVEEMKSGKYPKGYVLETKSSVFVYEGESIDPASLRAPSMIGYVFDHWTVKSDDTTDTVFGGGLIKSNLEIRAEYIQHGTVCYTNEDADFSKLTIKTREGYEYVSENAGNEYIEENGQRVTNDVGIFRFSNNTVKYIWHSGDPSVSATDPKSSINKFTGKNASNYKGLLIQNDQSTYMAFDGENILIYIVVRDDTPYYFKGKYGTGEGAVEYDYITPFKEKFGEDKKGDGSVNFFTWGDNIDFWFFIGDDQPMLASYLRNTAPAGQPPVYEEDYHYINHNAIGTSAMSADDAAKDQYEILKCLSFDRGGNIMNCNAESEKEMYIKKDSKGNIVYKTVDGEQVPVRVSMYDYISIEDLTPEDASRKTIALTDASGKENGWAAGLKIRVADFYKDIGREFKSDEETLQRFCKVTCAVQMNDRYGDPVDKDGKVIDIYKKIWVANEAEEGGGHYEIKVNPEYTTEWSKLNKVIASGVQTYRPDFTTVTAIFDTEK